MKKFNLYLTEQQKAALDRLQKKTGLTAAELIRRMIDEALQKHEQTKGGTK